MVMFAIIYSMFKLNKKIAILFVTAVFATGIVMVHLFLKNKKIDMPGNYQATTTPQTQKQFIEDLIKNKTPISAKKIPAYSGRPISEVRIGKGFNPSAAVVSQKKSDLNLLAAALAKNPLNINDWITVGVIKKFFNDYEGARDAWEYVVIVYPNDPLAFENLGNLYALYLGNLPKAEYNLKKAISLNSYEPSFYIALADFYKNLDKANKNKVPEIIVGGMSKIKDVNLTLYLASYYRDEGDKINALKYYEEVLKESPGYPGIQEEINKLNS